MEEVPRIAVLGVGAWGQNHARTMHGLGALALVCDPDPQRRSVATTTFGVPAVATPDEAFGREDIDAVVIATPSATHADLAMAAMGAGKDVLVEKPLSLDRQSAHQLVKEAESRGRILMVGHLLEYHPAVQRLRELVAAGALGRVRWASSNRLSLGRARTVEDVLWSFAPHDVALVLGLAAPGQLLERVTCRGGAYLDPALADVAFLGLSFAGGLEAQITVSWLHPFKERRLVVVGEDAMAVIDDTLPPERKLSLRRYTLDTTGGARQLIGGDPESVPVADVPPLEAECRHFLDCVRHRGRPVTGGEHGLAVLTALEAASRSLADGGAPVTVAVEAPAGVVVHPSATVDPGAQIGPGTKVWHYCHVSAGAVIGERSSLGQNVFVADGAIIGDGVRIQNNVSVYTGVVLEDGVFCGPSMVFTNVSRPRAGVDRKSEYATTRVRRGATLGANSTILCGLTIGAYAFVGAGAVVTTDVPPHALVTGVPARQVGWMCACGEKLPPGAHPTCDRCSTSYEVGEGQIHRAG